jgi:hypothetical protein
MSKFFLPNNSAKEDNFKSALPDYVYLPFNMGRSIPRQQDYQSIFISPPSNSIDLAKWINSQIEDGTIISGGGADGNGIYSGNGTIAAAAIATLSPNSTFNINYSVSNPAIIVNAQTSSLQFKANNTIFNITPSSSIFTDGNAVPRGIQYAADYSATFNPLSLVTKQYVDANAGGDGIYGGSGTVPDMTIASLSGNFGFKPLLTGNQYNLYLTPTSSQISVGVSPSNYSYRLTLTQTTATFTDDLNSGGLKYAANYSANYTARSLVDKAWIDLVLDGRKWKQSVKVATTTNITLFGEQTIDGILTSNSRVLVKDSTIPSLNGIYVSSSGNWTRTTDTDTGAELEGAAVSVEEGTLNNNNQYFQITTPVVLGTSPVEWVKISAGTYTADGEGIELTTNEFSLELDGTTLSKSPLGLKVADSGITATQINSSVAGAGLIGGNGTPLAVGAGVGIVVNANDVAVANLLPSPWTITNKKSGQFTVVAPGSFSQTISISPYANSDVMVQCRDVNDQVIGIAIDTTVISGNITVSGFAPDANYIIKYVIIA